MLARDEGRMDEPQEDGRSHAAYASPPASSDGYNNSSGSDGNADPRQIPRRQAENRPDNSIAAAAVTPSSSPSFLTAAALPAGVLRFLALAGDDVAMSEKSFFLMAP